MLYNCVCLVDVMSEFVEGYILTSQWKNINGFRWC